MSARIIEIIKRSRLVADSDLDRAIEFAERDGVSLPSYLIRSNMADENALLKAMSAGLGGMQVYFPDKMNIDPTILSSISRELAITHKVFPVNRLAGTIIVCTGDPTNLANLDALAAKIGVKLRVNLASDMAIERAIAKYYQVAGASGGKRTNHTNVGGTNVKAAVDAEIGEGYVISYIDQLLIFAVRARASDIHIEPFEKMVRIRLRMDGSLVEYKNRARFEMRDALITRMKIVSGLDIAEKRVPQDGNTKIDVSGVGKVDFRVSSLPTQWGEKIVLRILDKANLQTDLTKLGFDKAQLEVFRDSIFKPFGMIIVTGPTGSGKTTTLYSALNELNRITDNVVTAEDPVEYTLPGICQVNIRHDIGLTFAAALKAFLRQDPDVIMVGEIRDTETAEIAMKAALTGHIVLSTLHTNNAAETLERLRNMRIEPFTIVSAVNCVVAQRLMRKLCQECKKPDPISPADQIKLGLPPEYAGKINIFIESGCASCNFTGFRGRSAIYEVMPLSESLKRGLAEDMSAMQLKKIAMNEGMQTLRQSAWKKVASGVSSISEMLANSASDRDLTSSARKAS
jgi:type IV pilus assembly protein PilB